MISSRNPFGLTTNIRPNNENKKNRITLYAFPSDGYIEQCHVVKNVKWIVKHKVLISYAYGERGSFPYLVVGKPFIGSPDSCCTETYLVIGPFSSNKCCENVISYMKTKFFRFLVLLRKNTQHAAKGVY